MKKTVVIACLVLIFGSCLPDGFYHVTTYGIADYWVLESGEITETLELYIEKAKPRFLWTRQVDGTDVVSPVAGTYNVRREYDYGEKWYVLTLTPDGENPLIYTFKMTLSDDKRVMALEGSGISYYYRIEKEKDSGSDTGE